MSGWRFFPRPDDMRRGILVAPSGEAEMAEFLTPRQARERAKKMRSESAA